MSERVSVPQAAKELGMAPQAVRVRMKSGDLAGIGYIMPSIKGNRTEYFIYRNMLDAYMGKKLTTQEGGQQKSSQEATTS